MQPIRDAVIVGAGLAGMMAGLRMAAAGWSVLVVDRRARPGGRCGMFEIDGHRFTIGCNDFGARIVRDLASVGVAVEFTPSTNFVDLEDASYRMPPRPWTMLRMLRHAPSLLGTIRAIRRGGSRPLGELFGERARSRLGFRLVSLLGYALGTPPQDLRADLVRADFSKQYDYGHDRMVVPVGGPQAITDAMVKRFEALGGEFAFGVEVGRVRRDGRGFAIETARGEARARTVLTTVPPDGHRSRNGLKVAQVLFVVPRSFPFVDARTLIVSPPRADRWIAALDGGAWPERYGFHVFQDVEEGELRTLTGYLLAPRGHDAFDAAVRARVLGVVEAGLERHLPGIGAALRYRRLLDPAEYEAIHQLSPALSHEVPAAGLEPLPIEGDEPGLLRIGNAVAPPGDHANAAMLSGLLAAERALGVGRGHDREPLDRTSVKDHPMRAGDE